MKRSLIWLVLSIAATAHAAPRCQLAGKVRHVVLVTFDNTHLRRDNPNVPSDLEQMPHLYSFLHDQGALLSRHHTPLISHTATDILTAFTGLYGDRHGISIANSFRYFKPDGTSSSVGSFSYWTDPLGDGTPQMIAPNGKIAPAPWVPFTRAGCDFGAAGSANLVLENIGGDITTVFGGASAEATEARNNPAQASADFVGVAVHCASGSPLCASGRPDLLPDEPGGYSGYSALYGHKSVAPALSSMPLTDLDGHVIADAKGHVGFPGFDGMSASVSLGYVASMLEAGVPVVYAYISDAHDNHAGGGAYGPGEAGYVAQLAAYDRAFGSFFDRLAKDGIDSTNTLFVFTADEGDHFAGGAPTPASCDGVTVPCSYPQLGELNVNLTGLLAAVGITTPWSAHADSAVNLWLEGNPAADAPALRTLERALAQLFVTNLYSGVKEKLFNFLADKTEMQLLHMVTADPARTPTLTAFAKPDYYVGGGSTSCTDAKPCVTSNRAFAWNHGDVASEINTTWLGLVGPGVASLGEDERIWSDHADIRPTLLALTGLSDDYFHQGRVLVEALSRPHDRVLEHLGRVYKQINAPVGAFALASLRISTRSLSSGSSGDASADVAFEDLTAALSAMGARRDALATQMELLLESGDHGFDRARAERLAIAGEALLAETIALADLVEWLPL
jgi:hypothetical protein